MKATTKGPNAARPPREVWIDECEREELRLAKQRKRMAVLRNADHPCQATGRATIQQLTLLALFILLTLLAHGQLSTCHTY